MPSIKAPPYLLDLLAHLLRTLEDARGLTLDQVGMDEEHMAPAHRREARVALPALERTTFGVERTAGDDRFGIFRQHALHRHRRRQAGDSGKNIPAAAQPEYIADQMLAIDRNQRLMPDLVEHPHWPSAGVTSLQFGHAGAKICRRWGGSLFRSCQFADGFEQARDIIETAGFGEEDRDPQALQRGNISSAVTAVPADDQVGLQGEKTLGIGLAAIADMRDVFGGGGLIAEGGNADQLVPSTGSEDQFGDMG